LRAAAAGAAPHDGEPAGVTDTVSHREAPAAFSVATLSLRNGRAYDGANSLPFRRRWAPEYIRSLDCDIVGLQEAFRD